MLENLAQARKDIAIITLKETRVFTHTTTSTNTLHMCSTEMNISPAEGNYRVREGGREGVGVVVKSSSSSVSFNGMSLTYASDIQPGKRRGMFPVAGKRAGQPQPSDIFRHNRTFFATKHNQALESKCYPHSFSTGTIRNEE